MKEFQNSEEHAQELDKIYMNNNNKMKCLLEKEIDDISNILQVYLTSAPFEKK